MSLPPHGRAVHPDLDTAVEILRLLADQTRLSILHLLHGREVPVGVIAAELNRPLPAISQHLGRLRAGHLVTTRRDGATVYYRHANEHVDALVCHVLHQAEHLGSDHPAHHR